LICASAALSVPGPPVAPPELVPVSVPTVTLITVCACAPVASAKLVPTSAVPASSAARIAADRRARAVAPSCANAPSQYDCMPPPEPRSASLQRAAASSLLLPAIHLEPRNITGTLRRHYRRACWSPAASIANLLLRKRHARAVCPRRSTLRTLM